MRWQHKRTELDRAVLTRWGIMLVALFLVGVLLYRQFDRWRGAPVELWVARGNLTVGAVVQGDQLVRKIVREPSLPANVIRDRGIIEGRQLAKAKGAGSPFFRSDFAPPDRGPGLAGILPEGRVLVLVRLNGTPVDQLAEQLRFGDRIDLVAAAGSAWVGAVAHDAFFLGWISLQQPGGDGPGEGGGLVASLTAAAERAQAAPQAVSPLLLAVHPEDAIPIAEAQSAGLALSPVVHGKSEVDKGKLFRVFRPRLNEVELITGAKRERIPRTQLQLQ